MIFWRRRRSQSDFDAEVAAHLRLEADELEKEGTAKEEAELSARRAFGNVTAAKERFYEATCWHWMEQFLQDVRFAVRMLRRDWAFTVVAVLTLAIGIGMNTAVFSVINTALLTPLPYPNSERLMWLANYNYFFKAEIVGGADYFDWESQAQSFDAMTAYVLRDLPFAAPDKVTQARTAEVTDGFWEVTGGKPALGSLFVPGDPASVVLSDHFFEQFFGRDPDVVGRQVKLATRTVTIKGVLPPDFRLWVPLLAPLNAGSEVDIFATSPLTPANQARGNAQTTVRVIGKLKPGVSITAARVEMETIQKRIAEMNPNPLDNAVAFQMSPLQERLVRDARPGLLVLMAAVGFVLIIAAVNIASLLLARTTVRQREIAIRSAIGAGAGRLLRQLMSEGAVLGMLGGLAGVLFAKGAVTLMMRLSPQAVPRLDAVAVDHRVLLFAFGVVVCTVAIFSFAPATTLWRSGFGSLMGGRTFSAAADSVRMRRLLVGAEVGLAVVLLCAAGLMLRSFWKMNERPPGFTPEKVLALRVTLSGREYLSEQRPREYVDELLLRLENTTGVQAATVMSTGVRGVAEIEGVTLPPALELPQVSFNSVSADFGRVLGMRLIEGRWLNDREASPAILVNESFARQVLRGDEPVGKRLRIPGPDDVMVTTIVGVVSNLKYARLDAEPDPEVYIPYAQSPFLRGLTVLVLMSGDVAATAPGVRTAIAQIDRTQPVFAVATLEERLAESIAPRRFNMFLLGTFAAAALLLALVGIYGVVAYSITQRTREIGVRIALGARAAQVARMIIRQGLVVVLAGAFAGLIAASVLTQAMKNLLYGIEPTDAPTLVSVTLLLVAGGLFATLIPAMRAARLDPSITLRSE